MPNDRELDRLAGMANALRPDWPTRSVRTVLARDHAARAYADLAVALAVVATDPATQTPARLAESGPWWHATVQTAAVQPVGPGLGQPRCDRPGHEHEHRDVCRLCRAEALTATPPEQPAPATPPPPGWRSGALSPRGEVPLSPDCRAGKCTACVGDAWDDLFDERTGCVCLCHGARS